jgi:predicted metalloprotease with PDZ domain
LIDPSTVDTNSDLDGLLGLEALRRLDLFIDAGANALWIRPNGLVGQAFRYNRSGMALGSVQGRLAVVRVQPGSPAETAGLAVGDLIILPDSMTAGALRHALSDEPGVVITFQAARDGKVFPVRLVLRDLI